MGWISGEMQHTLKVDLTIKTYLRNGGGLKQSFSCKQAFKKRDTIPLFQGINA